jgi:hypothetical protein
LNRPASVQVVKLAENNTITNNTESNETQQTENAIKNMIEQEKYVNAEYPDEVNQDITEQFNHMFRHTRYDTSEHNSEPIPYSNTTAQYKENSTSTHKNTRYRPTWDTEPDDTAAMLQNKPVMINNSEGIVIPKQISETAANTNSNPLPVTQETQHRYSWQQNTGVEPAFTTLNQMTTDRYNRIKIDHRMLPADIRYNMTDRDIIIAEYLNTTQSPHIQRHNHTGTLHHPDEDDDNTSMPDLEDCNECTWPITTHAHNSSEDTETTEESEYSTGPEDGVWHSGFTSSDRDDSEDSEFSNDSTAAPGSNCNCPNAAYFGGCVALVQHGGCGNCGTLIGCTCACQPCVQGEKDRVARRAYEYENHLPRDHLRRAEWEAIALRRRINPSYTCMHLDGGSVSVQPFLQPHASDAQVTQSSTVITVNHDCEVKTPIVQDFNAHHK